MGTAAKEGHLVVLGETKMPLKLQLGGHRTAINLFPAVVRGLSMPVNLSGPTLKSLGIDHLHSRDCLRFQGVDVPLFPTAQGNHQIEHYVHALHLPAAVSIPPNTAVHLDLSVPAGIPGREGFVMGNLSLRHQAQAAFPWRDVFTAVSKDKTVRVGLCNPSEVTIHLKAGTRYGNFYPACAPELQDSYPYQIAAISTAADGGKLTVRQKLDEIIEELQRKRKEKPKDEEERKEELRTEEQKREWIRREFHLDECHYLDSPERVYQATELLLQFWDILSVDGEYGNNKLLKHAIHTPGTRPIRCKMRLINPALRDSLKEQLNDWLSKDVIEPSQSPWNFPLVASFRRR